MPTHRRASRPGTSLGTFAKSMIPQESVGGIRILLGRRFGIFPTFHKAALFLNFDRQPNPEDSVQEYNGDITVHGHTMYCGTCCDGKIKVNWTSRQIDFETEGIKFSGAFEPEKNQISGRVTLNGIENLQCDSLPIRFKPIE